MGYYNGGTSYDPLNPSTGADDVVFFRWRVDADPTKSAGFNGGNWNVLFDVDGDGYKEFWIDIDGNHSANGTDQVVLYYSDLNRQDIPTPETSYVVAQYTAASSASATTPCTPDPGLTGSTIYTSHTRALPVGDGSSEWFIDVQIPITAFRDLEGNRVVSPTTPIRFV